MVAPPRRTGNDSAEVVRETIICTGAEVVVDSVCGASTVQVMKGTEDVHVVWIGPLKPESGVSVSVAEAVEPGVALTDAGLSAAERGGVTTSVCPAGDEPA